MKKRILLFSLLITIVGIVLITLLYTGIFWQSGIADSERSLEVYSSVAEAELAESGVSQDRVAAVSARLDGVRVTVTDENAVIVADSAGADLIGQSRADRPEFSAAMQSGEGSIVRESATLSEDMVYYCRFVAIGGQNYLLRVGIASASVVSVLGDALPTIVLCLALDILFCFLFSWIATGAVLRPVEALTREAALSGGRQVHTKYKELQPVAKMMNEMTAEIEDKVSRMREDRRMETLILDSMEHGIVIFRDPEDVILINRTASRFLNYDTQGTLTAFARDAEVAAVLAARESASLLRTEDGRDYSLRFTFHENTCVLLITDITDSMAAARSKNEFIANVTHEMNTPLTSIRGFAELMAAGSLSPERAQNAAKTIIKQSDRLANLVKSIINFSQIDSDELPDEDVNLSELVREAASVFEPKIQKRAIHFTLEIEEGVKVRSRRERLFEIVNNLISNGVRYNRDGGTLTVTLTGGAEPALTVRDTGIGIAEEDKERIFDRFYTVDKSHGGGGGGFGLGLAIVKKLCKRAGWLLSVESKLGEGTAFTVRFVQREKKRA